ncbi:hypothetical protein F183_A36190 [Bryobacterales bacterium F-183]|nr:hypothetical protein F183_A36190 [Bryobacterales bacterium F-183]
MLPNLLDDLLKAWDAKATEEPGQDLEHPQPDPVAGETAVPTPIVVAEAMDPVEVMPVLDKLAVPLEEPPAIPEQLSPQTPMDDLLSSLLASFEEVPEPLSPPTSRVETAAPLSTPTAAGELEDVPLPPPPAIRERETLEPLAAPQAAPLKTRKFVAVGFGRRRLAFPIDAVVEAGRYPQTTFVPGLPPHVRGVFAFRGAVLPVVDTRILTGAPERFLPQDCRVLTLHSGSATAAFVFDTLEGIVNLDPERMTPLPQQESQNPETMQSVLCGENRDANGQTFGIADAARLLDLAGCLKEQA